jgi:hypothetical protein
MSGEQVKAAVLTEPSRIELRQIEEPLARDPARLLGL